MQFLVHLFMMTRSEHAPWAQWRIDSDVFKIYWQDRNDCFTDIQPNSISLFYRSSFVWCTFSALIWLAPGAEAKLQCTSEKSPVWFGCKKIHRFHVSIKAFLVKKKGTQTAVLSRVAKLRSVVALLHGWTQCSQHYDRTPQRLRNETDKSFSFRNRITLVFESCSRSLTIY